MNELLVLPILGIVTYGFFFFNFSRFILFKGAHKELEREKEIILCFTPQMAPTFGTGLVQAEARSQEFHPGLPHG